jgi:1,2-diacylglycerol-3-alpha-glucose alpha-1,2-glucosyltransferase
MKVCIYFEAEKLIQTSGIGRAQSHQKKALELVGIPYTTDPNEDYDLLHINTYAMNAANEINKAHAAGKPVIFHAHSTEEDFKNSFILSNQLAPLFKLHLINMYSMAELLITPTPYAKGLIENYGITKPIIPVSNGVDIHRYARDEEKVKAFRKYFSLKSDQKVVMGVGFYFERKGIVDFIEVARRCPELTFIWFGYTAKIALKINVRVAMDNLPPNIILPGYVRGPIIEGAFSDADAFFFPSFEETEGIVVLEALAAQCPVLVREIGAFDPWLISEKNCLKANTVEGFVKQLRRITTHQIDTTPEGYMTAKERDLPEIGKQLKAVYEKVLTMPIGKE